MQSPVRLSGVDPATTVDLASPDASADDPGRLCWAFVVRRASLDARSDSAGAQPTVEVIVIDARSGAIVYQGAQPGREAGAPRRGEAFHGSAGSPDLSY